MIVLVVNSETVPVQPLVPAGQESFSEATPFLTVAVLAIVAAPAAGAGDGCGVAGTVDGLGVGRVGVDRVHHGEVVARAAAAEVREAVARAESDRRPRRRRRRPSPRHTLQGVVAGAAVGDDRERDVRRGVSACHCRRGC